MYATRFGTSVFVAVCVGVLLVDCGGTPQASTPEGAYNEFVGALAAGEWSVVYDCLPDTARACIDSAHAILGETLDMLTEYGFKDTLLSVADDTSLYMMMLIDTSSSARVFFAGWMDFFAAEWQGKEVPQILEVRTDGEGRRIVVIETGSELTFVLGNDGLWRTDLFNEIAEDMERLAEYTREELSLLLREAPLRR